MQLGTRWVMGAEPPARLPAEVVAAIREVERDRDTASSPRRWTLTWLEGRPIVELDPATDSDEFTTITVDPDDHSVSVRTENPDDEMAEDS